MIKRWKKPAAALLALSIAAVPCQAFASESTEITYTEEVLAKLADNNLEYDELAGLIDRYNATVQNNKKAFSDFKRDYGIQNDEVSDSYNELANELENSLSGEDDAGSLISDLSIETRVKNLRETADDNLEDSAIVWWGYEEARDNLVVVAQSNMISYKKGLAQLEATRKNAELMDARYDLAQAKRAAGIATDMDVLDAKEAMINAQTAVTTQESSIREVKQKLCVMTGWDYNAEPVIGEIPEPDWDRIASLDPQADLQTALDNNYTLKTNKKKLENATSESTKSTLQQTIKENQEQIGVSLQTAAQNVQSAKIAYDQAVSEKQLQEQNLSLAAVKMQAGTMTALDYQQQEYDTLSSQIAEQTARMDLLEAQETYDWAVAGLASAGN